MAPPTLIRFGTMSYRLDSRNVSSQRTVNMYAERHPPDAKSEITVKGAPGITGFATCGVGPVRGFCGMNGVLYVLSGGTLYSVSSVGVAVAVGGTVSGTGVVSMDTNGTEIVIVNGANGYVYSVATGFQLISDTDFHAANTVSFMDSFMAFDRAGTNEWFISDSNAATTYSDLFASAESRPDNVLAVLNYLQRMHIFGAETTELWRNTGAANFPFQRIDGGIIPRGIIGPYAKAAEDSAVHFVADDRVAYRINGPVVERRSTHAIEAAWRGYPIVADCSGLAYSYDGHKFVNFTFPSQGATWTLDLSTGLWHERVSYDLNGQSLGRWRGNCAIDFYKKTLIGDAFSGKVGYLDASVFTEFGNPLYAEMISAPIHANGKRVFMPWFELDIEAGVGLASGQGSDPQVQLSISDDGGRSWDDQQPWQAMGPQGATGTLLRWDRLGSFYERAIKVTMNDAVRRTVIGARCPELSAAA